ncbi:MAG: gluconokinase [Chloroflexota bacterium]|nr:gluconokinase [Chloroflexota bacterium]
MLALDLGTSSVRALIFDRLGRNLGGTQIPYAWEATPDGGVEVDADALVARVIEAVDSTTAWMGKRASEIVAVGIAALWHSLVGVGADGTAVTPVYAWSDTRAASAAQLLRGRLDEAAVHARTGAVFHPSYVPARLMWLSETQPAVLHSVSYWMSAAEYVTLRLFGERRVSLSMASATGLFHQNARTWDAALLSALPVDPAQLSPLVDMNSPFRGLRPEFASRWPALGAVPWLPPVGDGACANVGSGCTSADQVALSLGTSGALRVLSRAAQVDIPPGLWCYLLDHDRFVVGGAVSNGGGVLGWMGGTLRLPPADELERALAALLPDGHGLTVLPFFAGERSPDWSLTARAAVIGLTLSSTPVEILRAAMEAVVYRLVLIHRLLRGSFPELRTIVASGGAFSRAPVWAQILTDALGQPVALSEESETTSRGAALLALEVVGALPSAADAPPPLTRTIMPDPDHYARYAVALNRYRELDRILADWQRGTTTPS